MKHAVEPPGRLNLAAREARRRLNSFSVRLALSVLIIISLLPYEPIDDLSPALLTVFTIEFLTRVFVFAFDGAFYKEGKGQRPAAIALLVVDFVALMSFLPWPQHRESSRWLRLFRLTRMLVLIGYWGPIARDLWAVLSRRERLRQVLLMGVTVVLFAFAGAVLLDHVGGRCAETDTAQCVDFNSDGAVDDRDEAFVTRLWWAFRQIQDPGNMVADPVVTAAVLVSVTLTIFGLFLVSFLIGLGTDIVRELVEIGRDRAPGLRNHTVVVHLTPTTEHLLLELFRYYRKVFVVSRYVLLGADDDRPGYLGDPPLSRVVYRRGDAGEQASLARTDVASATRIIVQAPTGCPDPDIVTTTAMLQIREANADAWLIAEILDESNASAARVAGGERTVIVPVEKLLGMFIFAASCLPRQEDLLRILLTSAGSEMYTFVYDEPGLSGPGYPLSIPGLDFERLHAAGLAHVGTRVIPVGVLHSSPDDGGTVGWVGGDHPGRGFDVELNPPGGRGPFGPLRGIVAVAPSFHGVRDFARSLYAQTRVAAPREANDPPEFRRVDAAPKPRRVLIAGFRPAAVHLCELLMTTHSDVEIVILVIDEGRRQDTLAALDEHTAHFRAGLWHEHGISGTFERRADGSMTFHARGRLTAVGSIRVVIGDRTNDSVLLQVPGFECPIGALDMVILLSGHRLESDARTAMAVLKIADLLAARRDGLNPDLRIIAEVTDDQLAHKLGERCQPRPKGAAPGPFVRVLSSREIRAWCTFQSVVVPGFDEIYSQMLGPTDPSFVRLVPTLEAAAGAERWTFEALAAALRKRAQTLIAVELVGAEGAGGVVCVAPERGAPGDAFRLADLASVWVISGHARAD